MRRWRVSRSRSRKVFSRGIRARKRAFRRAMRGGIRM